MANHLTDAISPYPFAVFGKGWEHAMDRKTYPDKSDTIIGNDVWIGYIASIVSSIKIGDGDIIAAKSVITEHVEPYSVVGCNPAKEIRKRFPDDTIQRLLKLKWWDWNIERITKNLQHLTSNNIDLPGQD